MAGKRQLLENVKLLPVTSGTTVIDRMGFLSAVVGVAAAGDTAVSVTHCDTDSGTFEPVTDPRLFGDATVVAGDGAASTTIPAASGDGLSVDIDLLGCKRYIQVTAAGAYAIALGDSDTQPVERITADAFVVDPGGGESGGGEEIEQGRLPPCRHIPAKTRRCAP